MVSMYGRGGAGRDGEGREPGRREEVQTRLWRVDAGGSGALSEWGGGCGGFVRIWGLEGVESCWGGRKEREG